LYPWLRHLHNLFCHPVRLPFIDITGLANLELRLQYTGAGHAQDSLVAYSSL
jgi:hypothetical protein